MESFLLTTEIEDTKLKAHQNLKAREAQILQLKKLLERAIRERDEFQQKCQQVMFQKLWLQNQLRQSSPRSGLSTSIGEFDDCDESIVSPPNSRMPPAVEAEPNAALPQKGQLLEAVVKAGPLLQNLLLAGPLPQWRRPPPPLDSREIPPPPVAIPAGGINGCWEGGEEKRAGIRRLGFVG